MNPNDMTYVGRNPCGCIGLLFVDATDSQAEKLATAKRVVQALKDGLALTREEPDFHKAPGFTGFGPCPAPQPCVRAKQRDEDLQRAGKPEVAQAGMF